MEVKIPTYGNKYVVLTVCKYIVLDLGHEDKLCFSWAKCCPKGKDAGHQMSFCFRRLVLLTVEDNI